MTKRSGGKEGDFRLHVASAEAMEGVQLALADQREDMDRIKMDLGELMHVYDDMQVGILFSRGRARPFEGASGVIDDICSSTPLFVWPLFDPHLLLPGIKSFCLVCEHV